MPLKSGKSKEAFSHNVAAEMNAGKPQKQALAIAYSEMRRSGHKMSEGGTCEKCGDSCKYAHGGEIKGIHETNKLATGPGSSQAGTEIRSAIHNKKQGYTTSAMIDKEDAKEEHRRVLGEMQEMPKPKLQGLAEGGEIEHEADLSEHVAQEFLNAIDKKDHKSMLEAIKALISTIKEEDQEQDEELK